MSGPHPPHQMGHYVRVAPEALSPLTHAWLVAADDLEIDVTAPAIVNGEEYAAVVHCFGSPSGTAVVALRSRGQAAARTAARAAGYLVSAVNAQSYETYDRELFIGTLDDWGWFGSTDPPGWYSGQAWGAT